MSKRNIVHIEFSTRDPKESAAFYGELFGWKLETDDQLNYTQWDPGTPPGGGFNPVEQGATLGEVLVYVASDDIEADLNKAAQLGGTVVVPKTEIPHIGWFGVFKDPTGNSCGLYASMNPEQG
jgi:predicted enzyme related to lactoylglutathione lyase